ncbi:hypothetical protein Tco_0037687 [Tanacetum coccineum]
MEKLLEIRYSLSTLEAPKFVRADGKSYVWPVWPGKEAYVSRLNREEIRATTDLNKKIIQLVLSTNIIPFFHDEVVTVCINLYQNSKIRVFFVFSHINLNFYTEHVINNDVDVNSVESIPGDYDYAGQVAPVHYLDPMLDRIFVLCKNLSQIQYTRSY